MKLTVYLCSMRKSQMEQHALIEMEKRILAEFKKCFPFSSFDVALEIKDGRSDLALDVVIVYDQPIRMINAAQAVEKFERQVESLMSAYVPGCRVRVIHQSEMGESAPAAQREPRSEEKPEMNIQKEIKKMSTQYTASEPRFSFEQVVLAPSVHKKIEEALAVLKYRKKLFDEWGLKAIMSPSVLLNLYGESGTGKTMLAQAIASKMNKKIIRATYADIESKYHGEGPKRLKAIFMAAKRDDAVLFIDEADSLLSARLSTVSQGSEQAINSMRSQLLISLEDFDGVVIFATNLIENYDKAFLTRLICIELKRPDADARKQIWYNHLYPVGNGKVKLRIPLAGDINLAALAEYDFCGRDIRNAVKRACIRAVMSGHEQVCQAVLIYACKETLKELEELARAKAKKWSAAPVQSSEKEAVIEKVIDLDAQSGKE